MTRENRGMRHEQALGRAQPSASEPPAGRLPDADLIPPPRLELLRVSEAVKRYPIGEKRLRGLIRANQIPHVPLKGESRTTYLIRPQAIEAWLLSQEITPERH